MSVFKCFPRSFVVGLSLAVTAVGYARTLQQEALRSGQDSLSGFRIEEVIVTGATTDNSKLSTTPVQQLDRKQLNAIGASQVSDAVKFFSGALVKDYGGLGGMKTLSVRSMGAQHTAISYDGIVLTDCQTGQTDLSKFSLEEVGQLDFNIGDGSDIFQTARAFASTGMLSIHSRKSVFRSGRAFRGKWQLQAGSFGFLGLGLIGDVRIGKNIFWSASARYQQADGDYPYRMWYGGSDYQTLHRQNNDLGSLHLETNLSATTSKGASWEVKAYHYHSEKGLPGASI
jgi:vitamin B12 transporter